MSSTQTVVLVVMATMLVSQALGGVLRNDVSTKDTLETSTLIDMTTVTNDEGQETTTVEIPEAELPTIAVSRDEDGTIQIEGSNLDQPIGTLEHTKVVFVPEADMPSTALSRDEDASIKIVEATLDPAPGTLEDIEVELVESKEAVEGSKLVEKSAKLLLLSTPRVNEKPKEQEENIEEPEEIDEGSESTTTEQIMPETTTLGDFSAVESTDTTEQTDDVKPMVTKLFPINEDGTSSVKAAQGVLKSDDIPAIAANDEEIKEPHNDNAGSAVLILDTDDTDYFLLDSDVEQFGSFTHDGSDVHLQPIVQSVEIVPTSVDDSLLVNYVHSW